MVSRLILATLLFVAGTSSTALGQPTSTGSTSLQARLEGVSDGPVDLVVRFFDAPVDGNQVGAAIDLPGQIVEGGILSVPLYPIDPEIFDGGTRYMEVAVDGETLSPRSLVTSVPYAAQLRGVFVDAENRVGIGTLTPRRRLVVGTTAQDIDRMPTLAEALVVGTSANQAGTAAGLVFDTNSRTAGGIVVVKMQDGSVEDHRMGFFVTSENDPWAREMLSITHRGDVGIGTDYPRKRLVVGTTTEDIDRMPFADEALVIGTTNDAAGTKTGLFFESASRSAGGIIVEKLHDFGNEDARMHFFTMRDGDPDPVRCMTLHETGVTEVRVLSITGGGDLAEHLDVADTNPNDGFHVEPGMLVAIDPSGRRKFKLADEPYDRKRVGIISGGNGVAPGLVLRDAGNPDADGEHAVALNGQVWCYADATYGAIQPGDLLTTSATSGHAMKATDLDRARFAIVGQALTPLAESRGWVQVLVGRQ